MCPSVTLVPDLSRGVVILTNQQSGGAFQALTYRILRSLYERSLRPTG
jgi:hypothetical protein